MPFRKLSSVVLLAASVSLVGWLAYDASQLHGLLPFARSFDAASLVTIGLTLALMLAVTDVLARRDRVGA